MAWMTTNGYYKRWVLLELDLYRDFLENKSNYVWRTIGDTPEGMPLDNNLNKDLHNDVNMQVATANWLDEEDKKKFSTSTPKSATSSYL